MRRPITMEYGGDDYTVFGVGDLAAQVERSPQTVGYWRRNGTLPDSPFLKQRGENYDHYYTSEMIAVVVAAEQAQGGRGISDPNKFRKEIEDGWRSLGFDN